MYSIIAQLMEEEITPEDVKSFFGSIPVAIWAPYQRSKYYIFLEGDAEGCVTRMRQRKNGIDDCSVEYVLCQNFVFHELALRVDATIFIHDLKEPLTALRNRCEAEILRTAGISATSRPRPTLAVHNLEVVDITTDESSEDEDDDMEDEDSEDEYEAAITRWRDRSSGPARMRASSPPTRIRQARTTKIFEDDF